MDDNRAQIKAAIKNSLKILIGTYPQGDPGRLEVMKLIREVDVVHDIEKLKLMHKIFQEELRNSIISECSEGQKQT